MHVIVEEASDSYRWGRLPGGLGGRGGRLCSRAKVEQVLLLLAMAPPSPLPSCPPPALCREEIVHVLQSSTAEEMERNLEQLTQWARSWRPAS
jgi:hypothetical protein